MEINEFDSLTKRLKWIRKLLKLSSFNELYFHPSLTRSLIHSLAKRWRRCYSNCIDFISWTCSQFYRPSFTSFPCVSQTVSQKISYSFGAFVLYFIAVFVMVNHSFLSDVFVAVIVVVIFHSNRTTNVRHKLLECYGKRRALNFNRVIQKRCTPNVNLKEIERKGGGRGRGDLFEQVWDGDWNEYDIQGGNHFIHIFSLFISFLFSLWLSCDDNFKRLNIVILFKCNDSDSSHLSSSRSSTQAKGGYSWCSFFIACTNGDWRNIRI